jgi:tripartite-type tricarboxylate transporter receptor subunit TctC
MVQKVTCSPFTGLPARVANSRRATGPGVGRVKSLGDAMKRSRRYFLHLAAGTFAVPIATCTAVALNYPTRPVHIIVGYPAGSGPDLVARLLGQRLSERFGQQFVVEDRPGAGSNIATEVVVRASPDGYTLLMAASTNAINAALYDKLNFDFMRDIVPIASIGRSPVVMVVNPSFPAKTLPDFIAYARGNAGKINFVSSGIGTLPHVAGELFSMLVGVNLVHISYRSSYMPDLLSGQVQVAFTTIPTVIGYIRTARLRALAVGSATRSDLLPDIPTVGDFVLGYEASG